MFERCNYQFRKSLLKEVCVSRSTEYKVDMVEAY